MVGDGAGVELVELKRDWLGCEGCCTRLWSVKGFPWGVCVCAGTSC